MNFGSYIKGNTSVQDLKQSIRGVKQRGDVVKFSPMLSLSSTSPDIKWDIRKASRKITYEGVRIKTGSSPFEVKLR